ncbi:MAG TPA: hypothetical protein VE999_05805 [Gemmataceae bacterium]|nr:hypothetical protein [Gemmataceae bacterium]
MAFTRDQAYQALASLHPAPIFLESYRVRQLPENLDIYYRPPEEFFIAPDTQEAYTQGRLIPILDDGHFCEVLFLDPDTGALLLIPVESPGEVRETFRHWQQYLAELMARVGEMEESDDRIRQIADLVGFAHTKELFEYFDRVQSLSSDAWWEARHRFPLSISVE